MHARRGDIARGIASLVGGGGGGRRRGAGPGPRDRSGPDPDHGGIDAGYGAERVAADVEEALDVGLGPDADGEGAVGLLAGCGKDPVGHLLLDHDHDPLGADRPLEQAEEDGRRDVVGDVAHHL
jgi:hypothetical protein